MPLLETPQQVAQFVEERLGEYRVLINQLQGEIVRVRRGVATLTWPGATDASNILVVPHTLGVVPVGVLATAQDQDGTGFVAAMCRAKSAADFTLWAATISGFMPANTETTVVAWEAWL